MILRINKGDFKLEAVDVPLEIFGKKKLESYLFESRGCRIIFSGDTY